MHGANCNSDHSPVFCRMHVKLKCLKKSKSGLKYQLDMLKKDQNIKPQFSKSVQNKFEMPQEVTSAEEKLNLLRESIEKSLHEHVPVKTRKEHKKWMTQEILELMDERRMLKSNSTLHQELSKVIRKKFNEAKEIWLRKRCSQIKANSLDNCTKKMHDEIRKLSGKRKSSPQGRCIRVVDGSTPTDSNEILNI